jgi:WD40 repeat protein
VFLTPGAHPDGSLFATVAYVGRTVQVWDAAGRPITVLEPHAGAIESVAFAPDNRTIAIAGFNNNLSVWDAREGRKLRDMPWHNSGVLAVAMAPNGQTLASADGDGWVKLWDLTDGVGR